MRRRAPRPSEMGMTLIEMLIVLAIIAVAAGAVTLAIGAATRAPSAESEARRLATRLQSAADDAMLGDSMVAFTAQPSGYGFARHANGAWQAFESEALAAHTLPGGMVMRLSARPPIVLGPDGAGKPLVATIESGGQRWLVLYDGLTASVSPAA
jgi:general secretion pathway protein H